MSPPRKRPRLHFFCSVSPPPGSDVDAARRSNDLLLKTRWESVFEKYERDFDGIGDEIGFINDDIVVNNGHLRSMQNEGDTGISHKQVPNPDCGGKRPIRAMTTAPSECDSSVSGVEQVEEVQEVIQSIETMTYHMFADEYSSDDDLFRPFIRSMSEERPAIKEEDVSDTDTLFEFGLLKRSPSVDSLFDPAPDHDSITEGRLGIFLSNTHSEDTPNACPKPNEKNVLEEQRLLIRQEVMNVLNEQKEEEEAKIEPAWRLPIQQSLHPPLRKSSLPRSRSNESSGSRPSRRSSRGDLYCQLDMDGAEGHDEILTSSILEHEQSESLWRPARRKRRTKQAVVAEKNLKRIKAESEDPLQGDFLDDQEVPVQKPTITPPISTNQEYQESEECIFRVEETSPETEPSKADSIDIEDDVCSSGFESEILNSNIENREVSPHADCDDRSAFTTLDPTPSFLSEKPEIDLLTSMTSEELNEEPEEWEVEQIADSRVQGQKRKSLQYKVIWKGYNPTWSSWREVLPGCDRLVQQFHLKFPHKPGPPKEHSFQPMSESSEDAVDPS